MYVRICVALHVDYNAWIVTANPSNLAVPVDIVQHNNTRFGSMYMNNSI